MTRGEFENLLKTNGKNIYSFCFQMVKNKEEADDLYQETMLKAIERCDEIDRSKNPKNYLIGIAVGIWKNKRKKYARRQRIAPEAEITEELSSVYFVSSEQSPEELFLTKELRQLVQMETAALEKKYQIPIYLYYSMELSIDEIAHILHIPKGTVTTRLSKARKLIKSRLEGHEL